MKRLIPLSLSFLALTLGGIAHAEGAPHEDPTAEGAVKPVVKKRPKPKPKPAPVVTTPAAPIPYNAYAASPDAAKALTPAHETAPLAALPPPVAITPAPIATLPVQPVAAPPPPPPVAQIPQRVPQAAIEPSPDNNWKGTQISLKCETQLMQGKRFLSQGTFFIDLFPSAVFPDEHADFKFLFVDPAHPSLIRESICLDTMCSANVTGTAYYLVNRVSKRGNALRITLDRSSGAFYAEEIDNKLVGKDAHKGEKGFCTPQKLPNTLF
jgi:hypothetical protein